MLESEYNKRKLKHGEDEEWTRLQIWSAVSGEDIVTKI